MTAQLRGRQRPAAAPSRRGYCTRRLYSRAGPCTLRGESADGRGAGGVEPEGEGKGSGGSGGHLLLLLLSQDGSVPTPQRPQPLQTGGEWGRPALSGFSVLAPLGALVPLAGGRRWWRICCRRRRRTQHGGSTPGRGMRVNWVGRGRPAPRGSGWWRCCHARRPIAAVWKCKDTPSWRRFGRERPQIHWTPNDGWWAVAPKTRWSPTDSDGRCVAAEGRPQPMPRGGDPYNCSQVCGAFYMWNFAEERHDWASPTNRVCEGTSPTDHAVTQGPQPGTVNAGSGALAANQTAAGHTGASVLGPPHRHTVGMRRLHVGSGRGPGHHVPRAVPVGDRWRRGVLVPASGTAQRWSTPASFARGTGLRYRQGGRSWPRERCEHVARGRKARSVRVGLGGSPLQTPVFIECCCARAKLSATALQLRPGPRIVCPAKKNGDRGQSTIGHRQRSCVLHPRPSTVGMRRAFDGQEPHLMGALMLIDELCDGTASGYFSISTPQTKKYLRKSLS